MGEDPIPPDGAEAHSDDSCPSHSPIHRPSCVLAGALTDLPMPKTFHFISGLPRSGSTLLAAILRQNPRIHAAMTSPVGSLFTALHTTMGQSNEFADFIDERQRERVLRGIFDLFYQDHPQEIILDTNRLWCARLPFAAAAVPASSCPRKPTKVSWRKKMST